jgi:hypothetical protein
MKILRLLGKLCVTLLGLAIALALLVVIINLQDEPLSQSALTRLTRTAPSPSNSDGGNAAYALWAFDAPEGVDATTVGRTVVAALLAADSKKSPTGTSIRPAYRPQFLEFPSQLACLDQNSACIDKALANPGVVRQWVDSKRYWFDRLAAIDTAPVWAPIPALADINAPLPPVRPLISLFSLSLGQAAVEIQNREVGKGIDRLEQDVRIARRLLASSDDFVMKMISTDLLRRSMLAYSEILSAQRADATTVALLLGSLERVAKPLSPQERSVLAALDSEAKRAAALSEQVAHPPEGLGGSIAEQVATHAAPLLFKPDATSNLEARLYDIEAPLGNDSAPEFVQSQETATAEFARTQDEIARLSWAAVYNPLGRVMASYVPNRIDDMARIHDAENLMRGVRAKALLLNSRVHYAAAQDALDRAPAEFWDVYTARPFQWDPAEAAVKVTQRSSRGVGLLKVPLA